MLKVISFFAAALIGAPLVAAPVEFVVKPEASPVGFLATGKPGFLKIRGEGAKLTGVATLDGATLTGKFEVRLDALKTGIDLRDEHMKETYLKVKEFPTATLTIAPTTLPAAAGKVECPFTGTLTLKGKDAPVSGTLEASIGDADVTGEAKMTVKLTDYPVGVPSYLGVTVAESVEIQVSFAAEKSAKAAH